MKKMIVIKPETDEHAYSIAVQEFVKYYRKTTGKRLYVGQDDGTSDLVIIGGDTVNPFLIEWIIDKKIEPIAAVTGTEDYIIKTYNVDGRRILILAGGIGRACLYAVYEYFEIAFGCRWFWDGDVIPSGQDKYEDFDVFKRLKYKYRGLRYFAHRGLKRFQAEMWGFEDWKREIDYLLKRKLNMFMLRIGQDDLFQKAFPNLVKYPTEKTMGELDYGGVYIDRRLFWPLRFKGNLRKQVLNYAFDRGLMHPEDFGTMTHWYNPTPKEFLKGENPTFFSEAGGGDSAPFSVWDIRKKKNFDNYIKLTEEHVKHYGKAELFHTIGFGERLYSDDADKNMYMKIYMLERFIGRISSEYPNAPIFIAAWDIWMRYRHKDVQTLIDNINKERCLIFDYTSDGVRSNNFTKWGVVGKTSYVFGIFHAYESTNDMLGFYDLTEERLKIAKNDEACKGIILWPEISHSDTLMQEFFAENAYSDETVSLREVTKKLCADRYVDFKDSMFKIWENAEKIISLTHWSMSDNAFCYKQYNYTVPDEFLDEIVNGVRDNAVYPQIDFQKAEKLLPCAIDCLNGLSALPASAYLNEFIKRDAIDIARTVVGKYTHVAYVSLANSVKAAKNGLASKEDVCNKIGVCRLMLETLQNVLALSNEFSLYHTLTELGEVHKVYDGFEITLKNNVLNKYCRTGNYELVKEVFIPECDALKTVITDAIEKNDFSNLATKFTKLQREIEKAFFEKPLKKMQQTEKSDIYSVIDQSVRAVNGIIFR